MVERVDLVALVGAQDRAPAGLAGQHAAIFIDVVAGMEDEVEIGLLGHVAPGGEVALLEMLAPGGDETQPLRPGVGRRRGAGAAGLADLPPTAEAIEVTVCGSQAGHLGMDGEAQFGAGQFLAAGDDAGEAVILRHLPGHREGDVRQAAHGCQGVSRQAGPQHHPVR